MKIADVGLFVAMPLGQASICLEGVVGLIETALAIPMKFRVRQSSYLPHNRAHLFQEFLDDEEGTTHLLWVDSDIGFRPSNIATLLEADVGAVGAVYATKDERCQPVFQRNDQPHRGPLIPVDRIGFGFLLIRRSAAEHFARAQKSMLHQGDALADVFTPEPGTGDSEDWAFCRRWIDAGLPLFAHAGCALPHFGESVYMPGGS